MDTVGRPLATVITELEARQVPYRVTVTSPPRNKFRLEQRFYVIRQRMDDDGVFHMVVASKMGKEVSN